MPSSPYLVLLYDFRSVRLMT